jgi:hypothetical protein
MLKADNGATMETDLVETPTGCVAHYLIVQAPRAAKAAAGAVSEQGGRRGVARC